MPRLIKTEDEQSIHWSEKRKDACGFDGKPSNP